MTTASTTKFKNVHELAEAFMRAVANRLILGFQLEKATPIISCQENAAGDWEYGFEIRIPTKEEPLARWYIAADAVGNGAGVWLQPKEEFSSFLLERYPAETASEQERIRIEMFYPPTSEVFMTLEGEVRRGTESVLTLAQP